MEANIVLLPGDGIGPEIVSAARRVMTVCAEKFGHSINYVEGKIGGQSIDAYGIPLSEATLADCLKSDSVLLGAVGGPRWDPLPAAQRPESGLLQLRRKMGVYANLRPVKVYPILAHNSPLKAERLANVDLMVVRELTGGLYFGQPKGREPSARGQRAVDTLLYYEDEIRRIIIKAFQIAAGRRKKVTSVDKSNVLETSRLWREIAIEVQQQYPDITLEHVLVDTAAMRLVSNPASFDVLVTENTFGDILTDEAAILTGSIGFLPSASLGDNGPGLYEPIHGSAPDIAGKGIANPIGTILSGAMLMRYSLGLEKEAVAIEKAVEITLNDRCWPSDAGGSYSTESLTDEVIHRLI